jgi:predicted Rossmann-fold nucleotide-binding protein
MKGKTVVMTGGTSGIDEIAAERLAQLGARIVLIAPDKSRGEETWRDLSPPIACIPASSPRASATKAGRNLTLRWLAKLFAIPQKRARKQSFIWLLRPPSRKRREYISTRDFL